MGTWARAADAFHWLRLLRGGQEGWLHHSKAVRVGVHGSARDFPWAATHKEPKSSQLGPNDFSIRPMVLGNSHVEILAQLRRMHVNFTEKVVWKRFMPLISWWTYVLSPNQTIGLRFEHRPSLGYTCDNFEFWRSCEHQLYRQKSTSSCCIWRFGTTPVQSQCFVSLMPMHSFGHTCCDRQLGPNNLSKDWWLDR